MKKFIIAGLLVAAFATPALAKSSKSYYISENTKTHHCSVTTKQPAGDNTMFSSRTAAKKAMAGMSDCKAS
jgi:hypothetical protein